MGRSGEPIPLFSLPLPFLYFLGVGFTAVGAGPMTTKDPDSLRVLLCAREVGWLGLVFSANCSAPARPSSVRPWTRRSSGGPAGAFRHKSRTGSDQVWPRCCNVGTGRVAWPSAVSHVPPSCWLPCVRGVAAEGVRTPAGSRGWSILWPVLAAVLWPS